MSAASAGRTRRISLLLALAAGWVVVGAWLAAPLAPAAQAAAAEAAEAPAPGPEASLAAAQRDLVELRFEDALARLERLLAQPGLDETLRAEALVLQAQAHVASGALDAAGEDWRAILHLRPDFEPDPGLTPDKAMRRFGEVRRATVGTLALEGLPEDATVSVDGRRRQPGEDGRLAVPAGERRVLVERRGFDPADRLVEIPPAGEVTLRPELVPNARTVVVLTDPAGVEVSIDGEPVGRTEATGSRAGAARLVVEYLPLGEHRIELGHECHRPLARTEMVNVDMLDGGPQRLGPYRLAPARAMLELAGAPAAAEVRVDGRSVARTPAATVELCPGERRLEIAVAGRSAWRATLDLRDGERRALSVAPRPNLALLGDVPGSPAFLEAYNVTPLEAAGAMPRTAEDWSRVALPPGTDLALATGPGPQGTRAWSVYSPVLQRAEVLSAAPPAEPRPSWHRPSWGLHTADSEIGGPAVVATVLDGGPAATAGVRPGDRVTVVDGTPVAGAAELGDMLDGRSAPATLGLARPGGERLELRVTPGTSPQVLGDARSEFQAAIRAAWAVLDSAVDPDGGFAARANLAVLFAQYGYSRLAVATWRGVRWPARAGVGAGTVDYALGRELARLGDEHEAIEALRAAAASQARAFTDGGPPIAPAARDRLADLGAAAPR